MFSALTLDTPSMATSEVALRPPLIDGDDPPLFDVGATPGASVASENGLRPFSGRSTIRLFSMVWLIVELVTSTAAAWPLTVTVSAAAPTSSLISTSRMAWTSSLTLSIAAVLKPSSATTIR